MCDLNTVTVRDEGCDEVTGDHPLLSRRAETRPQKRFSVLQLGTRRAKQRGVTLGMTLFDYFDRTAIIHLPERTDRFTALAFELSKVGLDIRSEKVLVPHAPKPTCANGFPSRGVYGNFLSHLGIIEQAYADNLDRVLILEDDAIFSRSFKSKQQTILNNLRSREWDMVFLGHSIKSGLPVSDTGLVQFSGNFLWARCYGVNRNAMPRVIEYLQQTIKREPDHPDGGKMYIDGALSEFRRLNPDVVCLLSSPCLSVQRGSPSSLAGANWYDTKLVLREAASLARQMRDELWRRGVITIGPPKSHSYWIKIDRATPWPK